MKLNQGKCHFLAYGVNEHIWVKVGDEIIWESSCKKLLCVTVDKRLTFDLHLEELCIKVRQNYMLQPDLLESYHSTKGI